MFEHKRTISYADDRLNVVEDGFPRPKKTRAEEVPSRVLHLRFLPLDATEKEVACLASPFGSISSVIYTKNGQAFIEFHYVECASDMLDYYTTFSPPVIRGQKPLGLQYSKYAQIDLSENPETLDSIVAANRLHEELVAAADQKRRVLLVQVLQAFASPVGYMCFYQALHKYGKILRIVTFKSGSYPQAFVEFDEPISCDIAKIEYDGAPFASGGFCRVNYCRQQILEVHQESEFCRDFTKHPFTSEEFVFSPSAGNKRTTLPSAQELCSMEPTTLCAFADDLIQAMILVAAGNRGCAELQTVHNQIATINHLAPLIRSASNAVSRTALIPNMGMGQINNALVTPSMLEPGKSPVILVGQLIADRITPDILFTLFGVYGDVQRVKILYNRKDTALVQFTDSNQASLAVQYLNGVPLFGKPMRCGNSKYPTIKAPFGDGSSASETDPTDLNRDYTGSNLHRYRNIKSRNFLHICAPSPVLHISSLPISITEGDVASALSDKTGHSVVRMKLISPSNTSNSFSGAPETRTEKKMALVEFASLSDAVEALIAFDGCEIIPGSRVRVSFSKYTMQN